MGTCTGLNLEGTRGKVLRELRCVNSMIGSIQTKLWKAKDANKVRLGTADIKKGDQFRVNSLRPGMYHLMVVSRTRESGGGFNPQ